MWGGYLHMFNETSQRLNPCLNLKFTCASVLYLPYTYILKEISYSVYNLSVKQCFMVWNHVSSHKVLDVEAF